MRAVRRALRRPGERGNDAGFSLIEMLVTVFVFGVVGTMLSAWFISGIKTTAKSVGRNDDVFAGRVAIQRLTSDLQLAVDDPNATVATGPFIAGSHDSVSFYANLSTDSTNPTKVTWSVTPNGTYNGTLTRTTYGAYVNGSTVTWPATGTGANVTTQSVLKGVYDKDDGKIPDLFRFLNATNAARPQMCNDVVPTPTSAVCTSTYSSQIASDPLASSSPLKATDDLAQAVAVEIYLQFATAGDGVASNNPPYYETTGKTGSPTVYRARVYPISNTVTGTSSS